jgi:polyribonucleotide 5'-hydroxyl-kinase
VTPCAYFFGHGDVKDNAKLYTKLTNALAETVKARLALHPQAAGTAVIIGPADADENQITDLAEAFQADAIVAVGNERLYNLLLKKHTSGDLLKAPKNVGHLPRDGTWRRWEQQRQFQGYFYGSHAEYTPFSSTLAFASLVIFKLSEGATVAPSSALPLGATRKVDETRMARVGELSSSLLLYSVLAVSSAAEEGRVGDAPAAGFVYVTAVDEAKGTLTLLSPCPGELYSKYLLLGSLKWIEK